MADSEAKADAQDEEKEKKESNLEFLHREIFVRRLWDLILNYCFGVSGARNISEAEFWLKFLSKVSF